MPRARLFGYAVDEEDGRLVITIDGAFAETAIRQIREGAESGKGGEILSQIMPIRSIYRLMSGPEEEDDALSLEELLGQNIDQSLAAFEEQLNELKGSLGGFDEGPQAQPAPPPPPEGSPKSKDR
jgi:hypothetical protein